jgi:hypothetical protein
MARKVSVGKHLVGDTTYTMYTVPEGYRASWNLLYMINNTSSAKAFTVSWMDKDDNLICHVFQSCPISSKTYLMFESGALVNMEAGQYVTIQAESGTDADAIMSLEVERNNS